MTDGRPGDRYRVIVRQPQNQRDVLSFLVSHARGILEATRSPAPTHLEISRNGSGGGGVVLEWCHLDATEAPLWRRASLGELSLSGKHPFEDGSIRYSHRTINPQSCRLRLPLPDSGA